MPTSAQTSSALLLACCYYVSRSVNHDSPRNEQTHNIVTSRFSSTVCFFMLISCVVYVVPKLQNNLCVLSHAYNMYQSCVFCLLCLLLLCLFFVWINFSRNNTSTTKHTFHFPFFLHWTYRSIFLSNLRYKIIFVQNDCKHWISMTLPCMHSMGIKSRLIQRHLA